MLRAFYEFNRKRRHAANARHSHLLRLPPEVINMIFRRALPTNTLVILRVGREHPGSSTFVFRPLPPGLLNVCQELRPVAAAWYYGQNTFLLRDSIFHPQPLSTFMLQRSPGTDWLRRIKIVHDYRIIFAAYIREKDEDTVDHDFVKYQVTVELTTEVPRAEASSESLSQSRIVLANLKVSPNSRDTVSGTHTTDGVCLCTLRDIVEGGADLVDAVQQYSRKISAYAARVDACTGSTTGTRDLGDQGLDIGGRTCLKCRKIKGI